MSNEELVIEIQHGRTELIRKLWEQVERLVKWKAQRVLHAVDGLFCIEFDDLYQSGYLALVDAVKTYQPGTGSFSTWFMYYLQTAFAEASGYRTKRQSNDPIRNCISLDIPLDNSNANSDTLGDLQADPGCLEPFESVEARIYNEQLRSVLDAVMDKLDHRQADTIRMRYFDGLTYAEIGKILNVSGQYARCLEKNGFRALRKSSSAKYLKPFIDFDYYGGAGLQAFRSSGLSIQERYMIKQEQAEARRQKQ